MSGPISSQQFVFSPAEMAEKAVDISAKKANLRFFRLLLLSILAGIYIALGAVFSAVSVTGMVGVWPYGFIRVWAGLTFCLGLILVVISGAELFTGNNLMVIGWLNKVITLKSLLRNWSIVFAGNFIGSIIIALLIFFSKIYTASNGDLGKLMLMLANNKTHFTFFTAFTLGILCNLLVCLAVWMTYSTSSTGGKILSILFPITAFIASGFEHSIANMYILPVGIIIKAWDPGFVSSLQIDLSTLTWSGFLLKNLLPVTLGNILGGAGFVGLIYSVIYPLKKKD